MSLTGLEPLRRSHTMAYQTTCNKDQSNKVIIKSLPYTLYSKQCRPPLKQRKRAKTTESAKLTLMRDCLTFALFHIVTFSEWEFISRVTALFPVC